MMAKREAKTKRNKTTVFIRIYLLLISLVALPLFRQQLDRIGKEDKLTVKKKSTNDNDNASDNYNYSDKDKDNYTGTTVAADNDADVKQKQVLTADDGRTFDHFFSHIPKTGGTFAEHAINDILYAYFDNLEQQQQQPQSPQTNAKRFRACNMGIRSVKRFNEFHAAKSNVTCTMYVTETHYTDYARNVYTVVRNPKEHVLSMYFHCKESIPNRDRARYMPPNLTDWLQAWVDFSKSVSPGDTISEHDLHRRYRCYIPINAQSRYTEFEEKTLVTNYSYSDHFVFSKYNSGDYNDNTYNYNIVKEDLRQRYTAIGHMALIIESVCVIFIKYTGFVPKECNCTNLQTINGKQQQEERRQSTTPDSVDPPFSHGVEHHGATYTTTVEEDHLIDILTRQDQRLYSIVQDLFSDQLNEIQNEYKVSICHGKFNE